MANRLNRWSSRDAVIRSLRELEALWKPPKENAAGAGTEAADLENTHTRNSTPVRARRKRAV